jgi:hypothetical protein
MKQSPTNCGLLNCLWMAAFDVEHACDHRMAATAEKLAYMYMQDNRAPNMRKRCIFWYSIDSSAAHARQSANVHHISGVQCISPSHL